MYRSFFNSNGSHRAVLTKFDINEIIEDYSNLRKIMIRKISPDFSRDEWAYLCTFIEKESLKEVLNETFGSDSSNTSIKEAFKAKENLSIWLPNNVSLLGPLMLIYASLAGIKVTAKAGSSGYNISETFKKFILENLPNTELSKFFETVSIFQASRDSKEVLRMSQQGDVRIMFGSNQAADSIRKMPCKVDSEYIPFVDHVSEAWFTNFEKLSDKDIQDLLKVFLIYGQAGCTSPKRVICIDFNENEIKDLENRILSTWEMLVKEDLPPHQASENTKAKQLALAYGWKVSEISRSKGNLLIGDFDCRPFVSHHSLQLIPTSLNQAIENIPEHIQTVGLQKENIDISLKLAESTNIKRIVPIGKMHHFSSIWDGFSFFKSFFTQLTLS